MEGTERTKGVGIAFLFGLTSVHGKRFTVYVKA